MPSSSAVALLQPRDFKLRARRGDYYEVTRDAAEAFGGVPPGDLAQFEKLDAAYRALCGVLYNFVPASGHPGGSISCGRVAQSLLFDTLSYDLSRPDRCDADIISYAAGHKALGLYALWAIRDEIARIAEPGLLATKKRRIRLEDLLGFRRNPTQETPLFKKYKAKALDGHPTCATPFVRVATGASGVGTCASFGLGLGALDYYGDNAPRVHVIEGEGGMTPGRVHEALAGCGTARLHNVVLHVDWNQSSIDSDRVCAENGLPGDYVQWSPAELGRLHDWNVVVVPDGHDFRQIFAAQALAVSLDNRQPTMIVYRTIKGWKYGIEGRSSHGAGHRFCSEEYRRFLREFEEAFDVRLPLCSGPMSPDGVEKSFFDSLMVFRKALEKDAALLSCMGERLSRAKERLDRKGRRPRTPGPRLHALHSDGLLDRNPPAGVVPKPGELATLRDVLGNILNHLNRETAGGFFGAAADLLGSTSLANINKGFPAGFYDAVANAGSRLVALGGICEDSLGAFMSGVSSFGRHIGTVSSYSAFIAALQHVAARLHGIGQQASRQATGRPFNPWIMVNAHAGVKTGEDGPTHADPQALQLLQGNFPKGTLITLTPWEPQEIWPLLAEALKARPAVICPFVTRPQETVPDRRALRLPAAKAAAQGVYAARRADPRARRRHGTIVLQGNGAATVFFNEVLPRLDERGLNLNVYYVSSAELFERLPAQRRRAIFPEEAAREAMGITDFTLPTLERWILSEEGRRRSLHPFRDGHYLGSGPAHKVLEEAGQHARGQLAAVLSYAASKASRRRK